MPRLQVLLPVKNGERFWRQAVNSVLRSLPNDAQLVVLNDGSTDATEDILAGYDSARLVVHTAKSSMGIASGLNYLVGHTDSEFVAKMNADDVVLPWRFRRQMRLLERYDVVFSSIVYVGEHGFMRRPDIPGPIGQEAMALHLMIASFVCHPTMMAKRVVLPDSPYRGVAAEDYDLWLRLVNDGKKLMRDVVPSYLYREHPSQISMSDDWLRWRERQDASVAVLESYQRLLMRFGVGVSASRGMLDFVQGGAHELDGCDRRGIEDIIFAVLRMSRNLSTAERLTLGLRIRRVQRRLSGIPVV